MKTFKVYWKNGTTELLSGRDIADAFNQIGYTDELFLSALVKYQEVFYPKDSKMDDNIFSCAHCKGQPKIVNNNGDLHICCEDCNYMEDEPITFQDEFVAYKYWNSRMTHLY